MRINRGDGGMWKARDGIWDGEVGWEGRRTVRGGTAPQLNRDEESAWRSDLWECSRQVLGSEATPLRSTLHLSRSIYL